MFNEVGFTWKGREYVIAPDRVMKCIALIEDVLTLNELGEFAEKGKVPLAKVAQAFGVALRYAGAKVTDEEIYAALFSQGEQQQLALQAVQTLLIMMVPPATFPVDPGAPPKKDAPASARASSKPRTRRR